MQTFDVAIVGGGPAGSTCAWKLRQAGMHVVVADCANFPRDKVCAGWITPQVIEDLQLDVDDYRVGRRFQPFAGFRVGLIGEESDTSTTYDRAISFGIRRCEFDHYLLERSGACLRLGRGVSNIRRDGHLWTIDDEVSAPMLIGAGGHFCPVARMLNGHQRSPQLVAAQEGEFPIDGIDAESLPVAPEEPELFFSRDLKGYGWCVRKEDYLNVGFGHLSDRALPEASAEFVSYLKARRRIPSEMTWRWRGHAYLLAGPPHRRAIDEGVLLIGDAAGLAYSQSGEGIRPAIESALMAAATIIEASGRYTSAALALYGDRVRRRFGPSRLSMVRQAHHRPERTRGASAAAPTLPERLGLMLGPWLLRRPWFVRHVVLDRWFLHAREAGLSLQSLFQNAESRELMADS